MFFDKLFTVLPKDSLLTFAMCVLASVCVAIVMRFFIKTCLVVLDKYIEKKHPSDKVMAIYNRQGGCIFPDRWNSGRIRAFQAHGRLLFPREQQPCTRHVLLHPDVRVTVVSGRTHEEDRMQDVRT